MNKDIFFIRKNEKNLKVDPGNILYIQAKGSYLFIVTNNEKFSLTQNLSQFMRKNELPSMVRVHRSFIVNIDLVDSFDYRFIYIGKHKVPIGGNYREGFLSHTHCL